MKVFWSLAFGYFTVFAVLLEGEGAHQNDNDFEKVTTLAKDSFTTYEPDENTETRINGVNGWYLPQSDGTLQWMDMNTIKDLQSKADKEKYGMFNPFKKTKFWLYSALSPNNGEKISTKGIGIEASGFNATHPTIFIAHGFLQSKNSFSLNMLLRNAFFETGIFNIIYCEWADALTFNYIRSSREVSNVGKLMAKVFEKLVTNYNMDCNKTHLIGHSLGAHVVGFAAKNINICKVPKITALDTAYPLFPFDQPDERLNRTDAMYVESIQTDGGLYGQKEPVGTASFYCNGGTHQPGCGWTPLYNVCCHQRSVYYFTEAVVKNSFPSYKCDDYVSAVNNKCSDQYSDVRMGDPNNNLVARGVYYVKTNDVPPYGV